MDVSCYDIRLTRNVADNNAKYGIEVEISAKAIIVDDHAVDNGQAGIIAFDANDIKMWNNEIGSNPKNWHGIKLAQDQRRPATYSEGWDPRLGGPDPRITFLTDNVTISNNVFGSGGLYQVYALGGRSGRPADDWHLTITGNLFKSDRPINRVTMVGWGGRQRDLTRPRRRWRTPRIRPGGTLRRRCSLWATCLTTSPPTSATPCRCRVTWRRRSHSHQSLVCWGISNDDPGPHGSPAVRRSGLHAELRGPRRTRTHRWR
jgi:hypothetical protein